MGEGNSLLNIKIDARISDESQKAAVGFLRLLLKPGVTELGSLLGEQMAAWRWANTVRTANKVRKRMAEDDVAARAVPPAFLAPLLEAASNVDDDSLQDLWAELLNSAVKSDDHQRPAYVETLKQLTADDARRLKDTPAHRSQLDKVLRRATGPRSAMVERMLGGGRRVDVSLATLLRLGLVREIVETQFESKTTDGRRPQVAETVSHGFERTEFGNFFVVAVTRPKVGEPAAPDAAGGH